MWDPEQRWDSLSSRDLHPLGKDRFITLTILYVVIKRSIIWEYKWRSSWFHLRKKRGRASEKGGFKRIMHWFCRCLIRHVFWKDDTRVGWNDGNKEKWRQRCQTDALSVVWQKCMQWGAGHRMLSGRAAQGTFSLLTFYFSHFTFFTGSQGVVVVLLLQINRVLGHDFLCFAEKKQSNYFSSCVSSCLYV